MSYLCEAFKLYVHKENKDFATNPYIPSPLIANSKDCKRSLSRARCFNVKYGSKRNIPIVKYRKINRKFFKN